MKYIDPTMALGNDGILDTLEGRIVLKKKILDTVRRAGTVAFELDHL